MQQGWVYLLVNPSIPGLVKIGQTTGWPHDRAAELSRHTGVATPFVLVFEQVFADCVTAEREIHSVLDRCGMRYKANREFFRGPIPEIIRLLLAYATETGDGIAPASLQAGLDLLLQGDRCLTGEGDVLQDYHEAVRCYQKAAERGAIVAFERLGALAAHSPAGAPSSRTGSKSRAKSYLKEGARRGNYFCYCELAAIAAQEGHTANFIKAWDQFFAQRATAFLSEAEMDMDRYVSALQRYVISCFKLGLTPFHLPELARDGEALVQGLARMHASLRGVGGRDRDLVVPLRWCYRTLLGRPFPEDTIWRVWSWLPRLSARRHALHA